MPKLTRDGHALFYEERGTGDPPVVLVHGWCCDRTYLAPQLEHLAAHHRTVAPDLLGHGQSDKPDQPYSIGRYADEVAWLCGTLGLEHPIVIGHSMGGGVSLELAARHPAVPGAIAMLDSTIIIPPDRRARMESLLPALRGPDYRQVMASFLDSFFQPFDDRGRREQIAAAMMSTPRHVVAGAWAGLLQWDGPAAAAACRAPALYVAASAVRSDLSRFRELCPQLLTAQVAGSGHFLQLEVPQQVNATIDRFLDITRQAGP